MNEKQTSSVGTIRPTKKQRELLVFIEAFIGEHGYSPSYREIMSGLNYTSVATVALHVNSLIKRGHLRKRDFNARSLEVVKPSDASSVTNNAVAPGEEKWLVDKVEHHFSQIANAPAVSADDLNALHVLTEALRILGMEGAAQSFLPRLTEIKQLPVVTPEPQP
jgi:SOS-response transcriptional repressor LexA